MASAEWQELLLYLREQVPFETALIQGNPGAVLDSSLVVSVIRMQLWRFADCCGKQRGVR